MAPQELTMLNGWLSSGMPAGTAADATCSGGTQDKSTVQLAPDYPGLTELPGEKCYEFKVHNSTTEIDNTPYPIPMGEHYANFYFKAPWPDGTVATRYGSKLNNVKVLHHWLLFQTNEDQPDGMHVVSPLPTGLHRARSP